MLTLKQWLAKYGSESCDGCFYNIPQRAKCTYKRGYCVRYDLYKAQHKNPNVQQLKLFWYVQDSERLFVVLVLEMRQM